MRAGCHNPRCSHCLAISSTTMSASAFSPTPEVVLMRDNQNCGGALLAFSADPRVCISWLASSLSAASPLSRMSLLMLSNIVDANGGDGTGVATLVSDMR